MCYRPTKTRPPVLSDAIAFYPSREKYLRVPLGHNSRVAIRSPRGSGAERVLRVVRLNFLEKLDKSINTKTKY